MTKKKVVILGAGFGGVQAARTFRRRSDVEVTIVDRTNHHLFQPLLYQVATGGLNPSEIASPVRAVLGRQKNLTSIMGNVTNVDYDHNQVILDGGQMALDYDYLILAMGGRTSYFGNDQWEEVAPGLKSLQDALTIRQRVLWAFERAEKLEDGPEREKLMTIVVVGGGPTGVELAGAMAELRRHVLRWDFKNIDPNKARVLLVEGGPGLLGAFPERLGKYAARKLENLGVELLFNERVQTIEEGRVVTDARTIEAENIIWAAGVGGHALAPRLGDDRDRAGRLTVEADLHLPGRDNVYCVGDMAHYEHEQTYHGKALPGVAQVAIQQGKLSAKNILRQLDGQPTQPFHYFDKGSMATIGRSAAVAMTPFNLQMTGPLAWLAWLFVHLMFLIDYRNRVIVLMRWTWKYFGWRWNVRLITAPPEQSEQKPPDESS
ncbi:MAG: NAD(P)/FAD-dependent oxidoreductase [Candidatus Eremiobacteraeota bacterium]|nr:NAD(P)/FAD-dependent oxidoreductase [Candidatus Eremiobacteraeota bacterium]